MFVATNAFLLWQIFCHDKHTFVATKMCLSQQNFCRDILTKLLSWQKSYLWQLPPMITTKFTITPTTSPHATPSPTILPCSVSLSHQRRNVLEFRWQFEQLIWTHCCSLPLIHIVHLHSPVNVLLQQQIDNATETNWEGRETDREQREREQRDPQIPIPCNA